MTHTPPLLETERLRLEPICLEHAPSLQRHFADWEVIRWLSTEVPWPYPEDGFASFIEAVLLPDIARGQRMAWALVPRGELAGAHDGAIGLLEWRCDPDARDHRGFWLSPAFQGRGLMTEAVTAFQDYIFFTLEHPRLILHSAVSNEASAAVKRKTGATIIATVELEHHDAGSATHRWELTREAWAAHRGR